VQEKVKRTSDGALSVVVELILDEAEYQAGELREQVMGSRSSALAVPGLSNS